MESDDVLHKIKSGDKKALGEIYTAHRVEFIDWVISAYRVPVDDAKEIYQQSILVFYENIINGKLTELRSNIKTYLFAIGKNKVSELNRYWQKNKNETGSNIPDTLFPHEGEETEQKNELIRISGKALTQLGDPCKTLLELYYYHKMSMSEITDRLGYKNENSTKNQKYKCLKRLKEIFQTELEKDKTLSYG